MNADWVRRYCHSLPHTTEKIQWGENLVFKVGGKIYAIVALEPGGPWLFVKSTAEESAEHIERPGIIPAPYLARAHWVAIETPAALRPDEIKVLLRRSYDLVVAKLPRRGRLALAQRLPHSKSSRRH